MRPFLLGLLADAARAAGDPGTGLQAIDEGLHEGMGNERWAEPELHRCHAELLLCCERRSPVSGRPPAS